MPRKTGTNRQYIDLGLPAVCRKLGDALRRKEWTVREFGRHAGISEQTAAKLLDPQTIGEPRIGTLLPAARALGLTLDGLFGLPASSTRIPADTAAPIDWIVAQRNWSKQQLAAESGLTPATISNVAHGRSRDFLSAIAIARAGGVSLDSLAALLLSGAMPEQPVAQSPPLAPVQESTIEPPVPALPAPVQAAAVEPRMPEPARAPPPPEPAQRSELEILRDDLAALLRRLDDLIGYEPAPRNAVPAKHPIPRSSADGAMLSNTHRKAIDRTGGAYLALPWPAWLPSPTDLDAQEERPATPREHCEAMALVAPVARLNGLVHMATQVAMLHSPGDWHDPVLRPWLLAQVVTPRWAGATRRGARGRVLWGKWSRA